jgi:phage terminase large subunit-like protein
MQLRPVREARAVTRWDSAWFKRLYTELALLPHRPVVEQRAIRRALAADPVAFAIIYLSDHLRARTNDGTPGPVTFSEVHFEWATLAQGWREQATRPAASRHAFIAPRETGKSTWWFLILPLWAAVNGHVRFAAAFAHSTGQAETHLQTFKRELETNPLLRADYPDLCTPARRQTGGTVADRQGMLHTRGGFVFAARGVDAASHGLKVGEQRPDLLIFDDVEPGESNYSPFQAEKRLSTLTDDLFPLNVYARVVMVGTVTMPGSLMHQLVKAAQGVEVADWIADEQVQAHHHLPIVVNDDGTERSVWPEKWPLDWLLERRHTRSYAKNYANDPLARDGQYWNREDFRYGQLDAMTRVGIFVDPAITTKGTSDYTGIAVVGFSPSEKRALVLHAEGVRLTGAPLRAHVLKLMTRFERTKLLRVEVNQGGDLWLEVFHDLPGLAVQTHTAKESKETRFASALDFYQRGRVLHAHKIAILEEQAVAFPRAPYDDVIDAVVSGVLYFLAPDPRVRVRESSASYA